MRVDICPICQCIALVTMLGCTVSFAGAQERNPNAIIYLRLPVLEAPNQMSTLDLIKPQASDVLVQELCRQAFLLASREHGSQIIRDESMGDPEPGQSSIPVHIFNMASVYQPGKSLDMTLEWESNAKKTLWTNHFDFDPASHPITGLIQFLEEKSRTELVALLKKELPGKQNLPRKEIAIDLKLMPKLLNDFTFLAQFEALRRLHACSNHNDPKVLAALSQAYSQLALLSRYHWTQLHRACQARSFLYAQRLVALHPKENSKSVLAACLSLAGYHAPALKLYEEAEAAGEKPNSFTAAGKHYARMDHEALLQKAKNNNDESEPELADYLAFRILTREPTFATSGLTVPSQKLGMAIVEKKPEAYPVIHRLCASNILGLRHHMTEIGQSTLMRSLAKRLKSMNGMPASVIKTLEDQTMIRDCQQAMSIEGQTDTHEPSWASVGQAILQTYFHQAYQRALFMHDAWRVPTQDYLEEVMPLLVNHPHAVLVRVAGGDQGTGQAFKHPKAGDIRALELANITQKILGEKESASLRNRFLSQRPQNADDLALLNDLGKDEPFRMEFAKTLFAEAPYSPLAPVNFMNTRIPLDSVIPDHAQRYGQHISYVYQFGLLQMRMNKLAEAEKALKQLTVMNPNDVSFTTLANLYLRLNNRKLWEETLEAYLKIPDMGLQPATTRLELAEYHATQKNWDKAKMYANEAAETYAAWALFRASRVFEQAGDLERSEELIKNMSTRYPEAVHQWIRWCIRNNKGDKEKAFKLLRNQLEQNRKISSEESMALGICLEGMNQPKEALLYYAKSYALVPNMQSAIRSAVVEGELGNAQARDEWMVKALVPNPKLESQPEYKIMTKVGELILKAYRTEVVPNNDIVETVLETLPEKSKPMQYYLLGKVCEQLKNDKEAKRLYTSATECNAQDTWGWLLCKSRLQTLAEKK